jgi:hypothetical protein
MRFLASDQLEGRGTGARGYDVAAQYVASQLESIGIAPAGGAGTYFQPVPLRRLEIVPERSSLVVLSAQGTVKKLVRGVEYVTLGDATRVAVDVEAELVSVGFGITAPESGHDDYAGIDVQGKIVVQFFGAPKKFSNAVRAYYADPATKMRNAVAHGAVGMIWVFPPEVAKEMPWDLCVGLANAPGYRWLDASGTPHDGFPELKTIAFVNRSGAEMLYAGAPQTLIDAVDAADADHHSSHALATKARVHTETKHTAIASLNVVGVLQGSDASLRTEHVVYSAHLDHLGIGEPVDGDAIYNGAVDNASGVAAMLAIAKAYASLPVTPRRSILFVAPTAEEAGMLGSDYFARFPTVPRASIVADVNIDGAPGLLYPVADVVPLGAEHSTLGAVAANAASDLGLAVSPDPMPEQSSFARSDNYSFVKAGIPSVCVIEGLKTRKPGLDPAAVMRAWQMSKYHSPKDDMSQPLDFESAATTTKLNFLIGYAVAQAAMRPSWITGDFFAQRFASR